MCGGIVGGLLGKTKTPTPTPPPLPAEPQKADRVDATQQAADKQRRKTKRAFGVKSTIATSPLGVSGAANTATKTLLGQ